MDCLEKLKEDEKLKKYSREYSLHIHIEKNSDYTSELSAAYSITNPIDLKKLSQLKIEVMEIAEANKHRQ